MLVWTTAVGKRVSLAADKSSPKKHGSDGLQTDNTLSVLSESGFLAAPVPRIWIL